MQLTGLPAISASLPWQTEQWGQFNQQLQRGQLPHALMLLGPRDTGKAQFALAATRLLLCQSPADGQNCGKCHACNLSGSGNHGDLNWLQPEEKSRVVKIDQIRKAVEFTTRTSSFGSRKVLVIDSADSLNTNAANALLKCLEEPAEGTFLLLICHRLQAVPATIRSRCQQLRFPLPAENECADWVDLLSGSRERSQALLELAGGAPLLAERLNREGLAEQLATLRQSFDALRSGGITPQELFTVLDSFPLDEALEHLQLYLLQWVRGLARGELRASRGLAVFGLTDELQRLQGAIQAGANPNKQLLLIALLSRLQRELGAAGVGGTMKPSHRGVH